MPIIGGLFQTVWSLACKIDINTVWWFVICKVGFDYIAQQYFFYRVLVGAPLSNVTSTSGSTLPRYGAVYKCEYTGSSVPCTYIRIDNTRKYKSFWSVIGYVLYKLEAVHWQSPLSTDKQKFKTI